MSRPAQFFRFMKQTLIYLSFVCTALLLLALSVGLFPEDIILLMFVSLAAYFFVRSAAFIFKKVRRRQNSSSAKPQSINPSRNTGRNFLKQTLLSASFSCTFSFLAMLICNLNADEVIWLLAASFPICIILRLILLMLRRPRRRKRSFYHHKTFRAIPLLILGGVLAAIGIGAYFKNTAERAIPASLAEFARKYPETKSFVQAYSTKKDLTPDITVSEEVQKGTIPLFLQWDDRWGYSIYGNNFFATNACGPTALSMVVCGLTGNSDYHPRAVADYAQENGYYYPGSGTSSRLMTDGAEHFGLTAENGERTEHYIRSNLSSASPMICLMGKGDFTYSGHYIVLTGFDEDGLVIVRDSNSRINSEKHWPVDVLISQMRDIWIYTIAA